MAVTTILKFRREFEALLRYARCGPIEITRDGRRAFVLMSAERYDWVRAAGRRAYRTTNATTVAINSMELAEMGTLHSTNCLTKLDSTSGSDSKIANNKTAPEEHFADRGR
jgi:prevent-host-death family protein